MAKPRTTLQALLEEILGTPNVYFQPGPDEHMVYPAIAYEIDDADAKHADNRVYTWAKRYQVTLMTRDPDHSAFDKLEELPLCAYQRRFATSGLNHYVFVIYH